MRTAALLLLAASALPQDAWWDAAWSHRRPIEVVNRAGEVLPAGVTAWIDLDPALLAPGERARADLSDLALVHDGRRVGLVAEPAPGSSKRRLWFRVAADIPAKGRDARYALYYGNPKAAPGPAGVFEVEETFAAALDPARWTVEGGLETRVEGGRLVLDDLPAGTERRPARLVPRLAAIPPGFSWSVDLDLAPAEGSAWTIALVAEPREEVEDPAVRKRVGELLEVLDAGDLEEREAAARELVKLGPAARPRLGEAARGPDAEARARAEQCLAEIDRSSPPPRLVAGVRVGESPRAATRFLRSTRTSVAHPASLELPAKLRVEVRRDADGAVTVLWNGLKPDAGTMRGPVKEVAIALWKSNDAPAGRIAIDGARLRRKVDDFYEPAVTAGEESRR